MNWCVEFSNSDFDRICHEAARRNNSKHRNYAGGNWETLGNKSRLERNIQGRIAEHAAARIFDVQVCPATRVEGTDDGTDMTLKDGRTAQVKLNPYPWGDFYVKATQPQQIVSDVGMLVVPVRDAWTMETRRVALVGWIRREDFHRLRQPAKWAYSGFDVLAVAQRELESMDSLLGGPPEETAVTDSALVRTPDWPPNPYLRDFLATEEGHRILEWLGK